MFFFVSIPEVRTDGTIKQDSYTGKIYYIRVNMFGDELFAFKVEITNETDHIVKFLSLSFRLLDPSGNSIKACSPEDVLLYWAHHPGYQAVH